MTIMISGECFTKLSTTVLTILAFVPINSSLVIPGFLGIPDVITATVEPAVAL
ncbi:hypothetical protein D3C87_1748920 [compost metagenome]